MRQSTLETLGLGSVFDLFQMGRYPASTSDLVDRVFGPANHRGSMVISGANGIVGAGKAMQFASRLQPFGVPVVALDFPGVPDGLGRQFPGLVRAFGKGGAGRIMEHVVQLYYDGAHLPPRLKDFNPRFLLEAIPEILDIKLAHYKVFKDTFPDVEIRSVTSGFPSSQLGVGIAHPAFPHEINKIFEIVEAEPSAITQLLWALGLIPVAVSDDWSFVLDVLFCGLALAGLRYYRATNMPFWKIDKFVRKYLGPNPFRAHDAIGAAGANFLTWSCLHHLGKEYGDLFNPTPELDERKDSGQNWYPMNHFRPLVNWSLAGDQEDEFFAWILGPLFQMAGLMLKEKRAHLSHINAIGELCAQFRRGILAVIRSYGAAGVKDIVAVYHKLHPEAAEHNWYPEVFDDMEDAAWQQLYVNAEHDGNVGVISINRESYNHDVNQELNRAIDWLKAAGIERVILSGDFHLSTQMAGADTADFFPGLEKEEAGFNISKSWSQTARRLYREFKVSVGFINGKRCLGGCLELMLHCHYLVSVDSADLGMPEVTLPVVPGMEGCHWPFRRINETGQKKLMQLLLDGKFRKATDTVGWLIDYAGPMEAALQTVWQIASGGTHGIQLRPVQEGKVAVTQESGVEDSGDPATEAARTAIFKTIQDACHATLDEALDIQARHSAAFMVGALCKKGAIGADYTKTIKV
jgi:enoyl-CoA hydratase/carnithine racemase/3-hydroxyacyl-CoA dehydrogenase